MGNWPSQQVPRQPSSEERALAFSAHLPESPTPFAASPTPSQEGVQYKVRYGILGGTFDPPHLGHSIIAQEVYARLQLDRVWFIPTGVPPHKQDTQVTPAAQRLAMVERAVAGDERFAVSQIELERTGPSYTVETLRSLRSRWGDSAAIYFVLGWDMLLYLPSWHDPGGVLAQLDGLVAVHRPGFEAGTEALTEVQASLPTLAEKLLLLPVPQIEISSSEIRERVVQSLPIRYLVSDSVREYIEEHGLYRPGKPQVSRPVEPGHPASDAAGVSEVTS